jgi:hypothetical protein
MGGGQPPPYFFKEEEMTDKEIAEIKETAKELGITIGNKKPETLKAEIEEMEKATAPAETPSEAPVEMSPPDPDNPDAVGLAERQAALNQEARLKALEDALILQREENEQLKEEMARQSLEMSKKPTKDVPERPNPNTMVYYKDDKGNICHEQVSFAKAKILLEQDKYENSPAKLK